MNRLKKLIAITGLSAICAISLATSNSHKVIPKEMDYCYKEIPVKHSKQQIEEIIQEYNTPREAFLKINKDISFQENHDLEVLHCQDRWSSMQETYALGTGDCEDGANTFKAMLSNHPEFEVEIIWLLAKVGNGHAISIYKENGKYGYVSFNERGSNRIHSAIFQNKEDAIKAFNKYFNEPYEKYTEMNFTDEDLKFGKALDKFKNLNPNWKNLD